MDRKGNVASAFYHPLFFSENSIVERSELKEVKQVIQSTIFAYDMGVQSEEPWKKQSDYMPTMFQVWREQKDFIADLYKKREATYALDPMRHAIANFISALFWTNGVNVPRLTHLEEDLNKLTYKPINVYERLAFVMKKPFLYHSFIQLGELYQELERLYAKMLIVQKKQPH
ncbi:YpoC family protein [Metabacillus iocasae]|uniref:YpoC-like domain-containing protein n=1 Tax=Priestia iocasae TaxID=2291674 RepID=A0ABS2QX46_9BACI|nr:hypothetical protein [Metabacillus iocasae]MBM7703321.1 hypothetical protein [Metabacillus iocasae]